ncbi:SBBP repeat-containing protein [Mucilaginibacter sp.]|jgi:sugar lactone lactonase YvrE|uniref:NHL domain-containing protein n=1 Tax=Mucilaginibacter sp. TaxID=1882438 RepID=UPI002D184955|nr:SBBP repeat-containing protein [Mucilaginibacter sp.]HTI59385.1 SBBP repeat-containing protein [Mucilaginibacter sp.]
MKSTIKFVFNSFAVAALIGLAGCSNKQSPAPSNADTNPAIVYNAGNHAAQYPTTGMMIGANGNLYIADVATNTIKMITATGDVTLIAGSGSVGAADGKGALASFNLPEALFIDASNTIYVADAANNLIRKITPDGTVSTLAGSGNIGHADGKGTAASFNFPQGIAVDKNGNIYVSDTGNDLIRRITPDGTVSTLAGKIALGNANGMGANATFNIPQGLALDAAGNLYVADAGNNLVRKIEASGMVSTFAGSGHATSFNGAGTLASFNFPDAITMGTNGNLYVTEAFGGHVSKITPEGNVTGISGFDIAAYTKGYNIVEYNRNVGTPGPLSVVRPNGVAVNTASYTVYIADSGNNLIAQASGL